MNAWSAIRLTLCAVAPIVLWPTPAWPALSETEPPSESQTDAAQQRTRADPRSGAPESADEPRRPVLTGEVKARVEELEQRVEELREQGKYAEAIELAEEVLAIRREHQSDWTDADGEPAEWYEVGDAWRAVEDLRHLATLAPELRADLAKANASGRRMIQLHQRGRSEQALEVTREQLQIHRRALGHDHPRTLTSISNMGSLLQTQGKLTEAELLYREALDGDRRVLGNDHPSTLKSINNMCHLLQSQGKLAEAEPLCHEALQGKRRVLGEDHPSTLVSINNMGNLFSSQGKLPEAEGCYREALDGRRRVLGDDHPSTLTSLNNLGYLLDAQGKLAEAEYYFRDALEGSRRMLGNEHADTLISIGNLGALLKSQGKLAQAKPLYREALEGHRRVLGDGHPDTLTSINNMGILLRAQGKLAEAEPYLREALEGSRRVLGEEHPDTLDSMNNMGGLLYSQGKLTEAEGYYREVLEGRRRVLGDSHASTLNSINDMGGLLKSQGKLAEAELLCREALEGKRRVLGDDHPSTLVSIHNMGSLLRDQGKLAEAEPYLREALEGSRRVLGKEHPDTLTLIDSMGTLLERQGKLVDAEPRYRQALEGRRRVLGNDHPSTLVSIHSIGAVLQAQGKMPEAEPYLREALTIAERQRTGIIGEERSRAAYAGKLGLARIAARLSSLLIETDRPAEAWSVTERGRARAILDLLARNDRDLVELVRIRAEQSGDAKAIGMLQDVLGKEQQSRVNLTTVEALLAGTRKQRKHTETRDDLSDDEKSARLAKLDQQIADQEQEVKSKRRMVADAGATVLMELRGLFPDAQPMPIEEIQAGLKQGELALSYTWTEESVTLLTAWAAGYGDVESLVLVDGKEEVQELAELVRQVRSSITEASTDPSAAGNADAVDRLSTRLLPEAVRKQVQAAERLIVLPDGPLTGIPFEALGVGGTETLADKSAVAAKVLLDVGPQIVYAGSATMYLNRRAAARQKSHTGPPSAVVLGDPVFHREPLPEPDYPKEGVLLAMVAPDSNAAKAGLSRGDVLLSYDGKKLPDPEALGPAIAGVYQVIESGERKADEPVKLTFWRDGKTHDTSLSPGRMGVRPSRGNPADGLRSMVQTSRSVEQRGAEVSATDQVRLYGGTLTPLPGTAREAKSIAELFQSASRSPTKAGTGTDSEGSKNKGNVVLLLSENATISKLAEAVPGKRFVHLASHGLIGSSDRPYDASLALTQPKMATPEDIGFLRLEDLIRTWRGKLADCDLVVLSACDTQRGVRRGTSVMTLPVGFMYAGAPTVVASLWKVDDTATTLLMVRFYENLLGRFAESRTVAGNVFTPGKGMPKAWALREAKLWLRGLTAVQVRTVCAEYDLPLPSVLARGEPGPMRPAETPERPFEHPYFWSAFTLSGDPN